ncbi:MAG: hypothetical protein JXA04_02065 [Gammaproteobacteria bacterium]|nr:hypothetical protein [Gammaproteobacteria bacterium]
MRKVNSLALKKTLSGKSIKEFIKYLAFIFTVLIVLTGATCTPIQIEEVLENPYQNYPYWYKVQTHAHSTRSDGSNGPGKVFYHYVQKDYRAMALTDHDIPCGIIFDDPLVDSEIIGIVYIPSEEDGDWGSEHMLAINLDPGLASNGPCGPEHEWPAQRRIDYVINQGGIAVLAHPYDSDHGWSENKILNDLDRFTGIEIFNPGQRGPGGGNNMRTINLWDRLLQQGRKVWGFSGDDCHDVDGDHFNLGWILVNSNKNAREYWEGENPKDPQEFRNDLVANIKLGNFLAMTRNYPPDGHGSTDTGPQVKIQTLGGIVSVSTEEISSKIRIIGNSGNILASARNKNGLSYTLTGEEKYLRVEVEQLKNGVEILAYSQPLMVKLN